MTLQFKDKIEEFRYKFKQNIQDKRTDFLIQRDIILNLLKNEFISAKGPQKQKIQNGVIFSLRSLEIQAKDLRTKNINYFKSLLCAAWINSIYDKVPDYLLIPPVRSFIEKGQKITIPSRIQPGHLRIEFAYLIGNSREISIESRLAAKKGEVIAKVVGIEIRALGAIQLRVILSNIFGKESEWYLGTAFDLPVRKTIYFSQYNPRNASKGGIHNYIRLDNRNRIVDFHYEDWHLVQFVKKMLHPIVLNYIEKNGGFKKYMENQPDIKIKIAPYLQKYFEKITFPE